MCFTGCCLCCTRHCGSFSSSIRLGLESTDLKLLTALVVAVFLAVPYWKGRYFTKPVRKEGAPHA